MGWAVAVVGMENKVGRRKWRAEVGPRMRGARPRPLWLAGDPSCQELGERGSTPAQHGSGFCLGPNRLEVQQ
jgi:hypothetical protein